MSKKMGGRPRGSRCARAASDGRLPATRVDGVKRSRRDPPLARRRRRLIEGQDFIDAQDELSVLEFMEKYGMPETVNEEIFIAMAKALDFTDPNRMSMTVILTAMSSA